MSSVLRLGERFKQAVGITSGNKDWRPTSNARNTAMLAEVRRFAQELKAVLKTVKEAQVQVDSTITIYKGVLLAPLPKAHDETPAGVVPVDKDDHPIGLTAQPEGLAAASTEMGSSLQTRVISPLEEWLTEYRKTKKLNERCEALRLDLDKQRRDTACLQEKLAKQQAVNHKDTEATKVKALTETDKLNRLAERYAEQEAEVFNSFLRLIRDSAVLRDIMAESVAILQRSLTTAFAAFNVGAPVNMPTLPEPVKPMQLTYPSAGGEAPPHPVPVPMPMPGGMTPEQAAALSAGGSSFPAPIKSGLPEHAPDAMYGRPASPNGDVPPPSYPAMHSGDAGAMGMPPPPAWQPLPEPVKPAYNPDGYSHPSEAHAADGTAQVAPPAHGVDGHPAEGQPEGQARLPLPAS